MMDYINVRPKADEKPAYQYHYQMFSCSFAVCTAFPSILV